MSTCHFLETQRIFTNSVVVLVLLSLNLMPLEPVFAQTATDVPPQDVIQKSTSNQLSKDGGTVSVVSSPSSKTSSDTTVTDSSSQKTSNLQSKPAVMTTSSMSTDAPPGPAPGFLTSRSTPAQVDMHSGALIYTVPIDLPPGRGVQPSLSLEYNSQHTNDSMVGYGWDISIPSVRLINRTGTNTLYTDPIYTSSIDGELAANDAIVGGYRPRTDTSDNKGYLFATSTNTWVLYDKQGTKYTFGGTTDSTQSGTVSGVTRTYAWMLSRIEDSNGNYILYTYAKDNNQLYPHQIIYSGHSSIGDGPFVVSFATSTRPDVRDSYASGFDVRTQYRISTISVAFNGSTVASYALGYGVGDNGNRSLLTSVQKTGYPETGSSVTLPSTTFTYATTSEEFYTPYPSSNRGAEIFADVNGNGLADVSLFYKSPLGGIGGWVVLDPGLPGASGAEVTVTPPASHYWAQYGSVGGGGTGYLPVENDVRFLDLNGDGRADLVKGPDVGFYPSTTSPSLVWEQSAYMGNIPEFSGTGILGDLNGDGLPDYVQSNSTLPQKTYFGNGSVWTEGSWGTHPYSVDTIGSTSQLVDVNGDGLDDWVYSSGTTTVVRLNTGAGWGAVASAWTIATSTLYESSGKYYDRGIRFMDINGDGLPDFVRFYSLNPSYRGSGSQPELDNASFIMLNTGNGWGNPIAVTTDAIVQYSYDSSSNLQIVNYERANFKANGQMVQDVLSSIATPTGVQEHATYTPSAQLNTNPNLPVSLLVVTAATVADAFTPIATTTYQYGGGVVHRSADAHERTFAGFAVSTSTDPSGMTVTYYHQDNGVNTSVGEDTDGYALMGRVFREDRLTLGGQLMQRTDYQWQQQEDRKSMFALLMGQMTSQYATSTGAVRTSAVGYSYATSTRDLIQKKEYGEVTRTGDSTFTDIGTDLRTTEFEYATSSLITITPNVATSSMHILTVGGGGAGGFLEVKNYSLADGTYAIGVGSGGSGGTGIGNGGQGGNSTFGALFTAYGGGGGGGTSSGGSGGSGGGGVYTYGGGSGTAGQGNNGDSGGGYLGPGGGAGGAMQSGSGRQGGNGTTTDISGLALAFAGGGSGASSPSCTSWSDLAGGYGGGGAGGSCGGAGSGTPYSGGGGGGAISTQPSGSGGAGIVVVRFPRTAINVSSSTNATRTEVDGDSVLTWKQNGTFAFSLIPFDATSSVPIISRPAKETLLDNTGARVKETKYFYDNQSYGGITKGNLTAQDSWIASSTYAHAQFSYSIQGLVASSTDPRGNVTIYTPDAFKLYPATTTDALGHQTQFYYNYTIGKPKETIDPNGQITTTLYDGINRPLTESQSDPASPSTLNDVHTYSYTDTIGSRGAVQTDYLNATTSVLTYKYLDAFDRPVQVRKETEDSGQFSVQDFSYNNIGLIYQGSLPYFASGSSYTVATTTSALFSTYLYDTLNRPTSVTNAVGTTNMLYGLWTATTTDANGNPKALVYDAFNRLVNVFEYNGGAPYVTQYAYDALDDLTGITDANANVRAFTYDGRGKRLTAQDLHAPADVTFGTWNYVYDLAGNLASTTDPKSQQTDYAYDALNRVTSENYTGGAGTEIQYAYDSCTYGIGHLCVATTTASVSAYTYDANGNTAKETKTINTTPYLTQYAYDRLGNLTNITYPDSSQVAYTYGTGGMLASVAQKVSGGSFAPVVTSYGYAPTGQATSTVFANGVYTSATYDPANLYRLKQLLTTSASTSIQNISYTYDANGNVTQINDVSSTTAAKLANYGYDDLNRLISATITATTTGWYNSNWGYRIPITASSTKVLEDTHDVYFDLALMPSTFFSNAQANGCDIRVTKSDGTTELSIDIPSFATSTGQLFFGTGSGLSTTSATMYYLYYGNSGASCYAANATYGSQNVYDANTKGVWHLEQNASSTGAIIDSTANGHNGTMYSNYVQTANGTTTGEMGSAAYFNGTNDTIDVPDSSDFEGNAMTIESWAKLDSLPSTRAENANLVTKKNTTAPWDSYASYISSPDNRDDGIWIDNTGTTTYAGTYAGALSTGNWNYIVLRHDPATTTAELSVRTNGSATNTYTANTAGTTYNSNDVLRFGADYAGGGRLSGSMDEIRVDNVARSDNFLATRYNDMNSPSTFWSVGSSTSNATSTGSYTQTYSYDALGNITNKSDVGAYLYQGNTGSNYANPHAPTSIASNTYTYDNNGNLLSGNGLTDTWDYRNQLATTVNGTTASTYGYDQGSNRVYTMIASSTNVYPNKYYSATASTSSDYLFANGSLVATLDSASGGATTTTTYGIYSDSLASGWADWSFGDTNNFSATTTVYSGTYSTQATYTGTYGGLYFHNAGISTATSTHLHFAFRSPASSPTLQVLAYGSTGSPLGSAVSFNTYIPGGTIAANTWYVMDIPLSALSDAATTTTGFVFQNANAGTIYYDDIKVINNGGALTTLHYVSPDNLGSTNVVTDSSGALVETLDYYPYGQTRIDTTAGFTGESRKYIGQYLDTATNLSYLNARYYNNVQGQFLSEDPIFLGDPKSQVLTDPQSFNAYSYARDNPITKSDPSGNQVCELGCADLAIYPAAAYFGPMIIAGAGSAAYVISDILLRSNGGPRWGGTVPTADLTRGSGLNQNPMGPEDWDPKNFGKAPKWLKGVAIGTGIATVVDSFARPIYEMYQSLTNRGPQAQQMLNTQLNSSSVQTRVQATQAYNVTSGASAPQQQLWVTPNGAVINWGGGIVAPAPSANSKK